jgi:hypothetical protein
MFASTLKGSLFHFLTRYRLRAASEIWAETLLRGQVFSRSIFESQEQFPSMIA